MTAYSDFDFVLANFDGTFPYERHPGKEDHFKFPHKTPVDQFGFTHKGYLIAQSRFFYTFTQETIFDNIVNDYMAQVHEVIEPDTKKEDDEVEKIMQNGGKYEEIREKCPNPPPPTPKNYLVFVNQDVDRKLKFQEELCDAFGNHIIRENPFGAIGEERKKGLISRPEGPKFSELFKKVDMSPDNFETNGLPSVPYDVNEKYKDMRRLWD